MKIERKLSVDKEIFLRRKLFYCASGSVFIFVVPLNIIIYLVLILVEFKVKQNVTFCDHLFYFKDAGRSGLGRIEK